jgi:ribonucleotide reductase alpha subunit
MNIIGFVVVAGNVRRSAQIAIGDMDDLQYLNAKRWDLGNIPNWRAMSNNSVVCNEFGKLPEQFWEGYKGNGEPYGLINLRLAREIGRTGETEYPDKSVMIFNPCVSGDTLILTSQGNIPIIDLVGKEVEVWNGSEWSKTTPKITGHNQPMLSVTLSNGVTLRTTKGHKWILKDGIRVEAHQLKVGDKLIRAEYPVIDGQENAASHMYTQGFYSGDGIEGENQIFLYTPKYVCENRLQADQSGKEHPTRNLNIKRKILRPTCSLFDKSWVPADTISLKEKLTWLAGLCDADATQTKDGSIQLSSVNKPFLSKVQLMLTTCGVSSKITIMHKEQYRDLPGGNYKCQTSYRLQIPAAKVKFLYSMGMVCERLDLAKVNPNRDASRYLEVLSIEESGIEEIVYCFTEPTKHQGVFNGILTGQCAEQSLANYETCCLAEIFLPNIKSEAELKKVSEYLYRINKHSLALPCHSPETEAIVHKNMRMGIGVTGYMQATAEQKSWLSPTYEHLRSYDKTYSKKHNWPTSIKLCTTKPSGTLSLLAGVTPGCHPGYSQYFVRRIRIASNSPLVDLVKQHGFHIEPQVNFDGSLDNNTLVASFPSSYPLGTKLAKDTTAIDQLNVVKELQANWSDNAVSCTIYYKKEELPVIREWLNSNYDHSIKTCSFLLHSDHGFKQAPYEEISESEYLDMISRTKTITGISADSTGLIDADCVGGACPIR